MSTPEVFFRETIDINRYGNAVAEKYVRTYNEIILNAAKQLRSIDQRQVAEIARGGSRIIAPVTRQRLRAIIKQSSDSLDTWWARSALDMKKELQGVAQLQSEFVVNELQKAYDKKYREENGEKIKARYKKYWKENRDKLLDQTIRRDFKRRCFIPIEEIPKDLVEAYVQLAKVKRFLRN